MKNVCINFLAVMSFLFALGQQERGMFSFTLFFALIIIVFAIVRPKKLRNRFRQKPLYQRIKESFKYGQNYTLQKIEN